MPQYAPISLTFYLLSMLTLCIPLSNLNSNDFHHQTKDAIKYAFFLSMLPLILQISEVGLEATMSQHWFSLASTPFNATMQLDYYAVVFMPIALMVSWSITEFSLWYMHNDIKIQQFFKYLLIFLLAMMILVSAGSFFVLFIGWEGVGIMSYLLIGWYFTRSNAGAAALQAVLYNRIGDIGFLLAMFWLLLNHDSVDFSFNFSMSHPTLLAMAFIIAAASKSAQFGLHPWLASAMEGPTPVSALLHSSTMVVAGVFLLIRVHPVIENNQTALTTCLCLGAISTAYAATCALTQNDIKKIIAYSTSSQLGLMIVAIGLNMPHLAFFHICTHAFFKAMLFLCSGVLIHSLNDEQDIRKMGGLQKMLPFTTSCITIGSLALMGTPYLAGFFSKDAIIEAINTSHVNTCALALTLLATSFTAVYSFRMMFFASMMRPRFDVVISFNENDPKIVNSISRLAFGSIIAGLILDHVVTPTSPMTMTMPPHLKIAALAVSLLGFIIAIELGKPTWKSIPQKYNLTKSINTSFFSTILHRLIPSSILDFALRIASHLIDSLWLEKTGPKGLADSQLPPIKKNQDIQHGLIKTYLTIFLYSSLLCLLILQIF